ncbi:seipin-2-like [Senna tora]|uniref:Seipin-2-like n=1 Tax=Senna tora TaxID=362788 RepID=A0A834SH31_9FABA|nr:seipin-2-like [Senna tora]
MGPQDSNDDVFSDTPHDGAGMDPSEPSGDLSPATIIRSRSIRRDSSDKEPTDLSLASSIESKSGFTNMKSASLRHRNAIERRGREDNNEESTITTAANGDPVGDSANSVGGKDSYIMDSAQGVGSFRCLLLSSLVFSGFMVKYLSEEPIMKRELLNFDYTKQSPIAYVPLISCSGVGAGNDWENNMADSKRIVERVIPTKRKVKVMVSLSVPESEYNKNLGVFQMQVFCMG